MTVIAEFGAVSAPTTYVETTRRFFRTVQRVTRVVEYLDWTIDGIPLRELFLRVNPHWSALQECTFVPSVDPIDDWTAGSLRALLGEGPPDAAYVFDGGRVAILFCSICAGLDCHTLSAEIIIDDDTVTWHEVGYQTDADPFTLGDDQTGVSVTFDRAQYQSTIRSILDRA